MGVCASKPREANPEDLPGEKPTSITNMISRSARGELTIEDEIDSGEKQNIENGQKEEPLLVDLSDPKSDTGNALEDSTKEEKSAITELISEIGGPNLEDTKDLKKDSDDPINPQEQIHVEEKDGVDNESTNQVKSADEAKYSQTEEVATEGTKTELETQKPDAKEEELSPTTEALEKKDAATFLTSS